MTAPAPQVGDVLAGKYRIERPLGEGGMAVVFAATHLALGRPVALKFVRPWALGAEEVRQRFMREAQATFSLRSEHAVRMLDLGELPSGDLFLVMELLEGKNLAELLQERGSVSEIEAATYIRQACDALAEAHALGIVHRDLKPANLFLTLTATGKPCVKVLDFGLAKIAGSVGPGSAAPLTQMATTLGTPKYMAPEQWERATKVDGRADLFSLGVILFQLLTGRVPHDELPVDERVRMILAGAVPSPRNHKPEVSESMARVVMRCLRPVPDERFSTAQELAAALSQVESPPAARPPGHALNATGITAVVPDAVRRAVQHEVDVKQGHASAAAASVPGPQLASRRDEETRIDHVPSGSSNRQPAPGTARLPTFEPMDGDPESVRTEKMDRPAFMEGIASAPAAAPAQPQFGKTLLSQQAPQITAPVPAPVIYEQQQQQQRPYPGGPPTPQAGPPPGSGLHGAYNPPPGSGMAAAYVPPPASTQARALPPPMSSQARALPPPKKSSGAALALMLIGVAFAGLGAIAVGAYFWLRSPPPEIAPVVATAPSTPVLAPSTAVTAAPVDPVVPQSATKKRITTTRAPAIDGAAPTAAPEADAGVVPSTAPSGVSVNPATADAAPAKVSGPQGKGNSGPGKGKGLPTQLGF